MTARRKWLQTALRAQQALTTDHAQSHLQAREAHKLSQRAHAIAAGAQEAGLAQWLQHRCRSPSAAQWDALHLGFHNFLEGRTEAAGQTLASCRARLDDVAVDLQRSHAVQRTLERLAEQADAFQQRESRARELRLQQEAWLLARTAGVQTPQPAAQGQAMSALQGGPTPALPINATPKLGD